MPSESDIESIAGRWWPLDFVRRFLIPVLVVSMIVVGSTRALRSSQVFGTEYGSCTTSWLNDDRPPSDVVFFGSSRTGAGVDVKLIADRMGGQQSVEKIVFAGPSELDRALALRTYLESRGTPSTVAIELSFAPKAEERYETGIEELTPTLRTTGSFRASTYAKMLTDLVRRDDVAWSDVMVRTRVWSPIQFWLHRLSSGWDVAARHPQIAVNPKQSCGENRLGIDGKSEPFDASSPGGSDTPTDKDQTRWTAAAERVRAFDPSAPFTLQELALVRDMVDTSKDAGARQVVLYFLPAYGQTDEALDTAWLQGEFPDTIVWDGREILFDSDRSGLEQQFGSKNHVNRFGAYELSAALAADLAGKGPNDD